MYSKMERLIANDSNYNDSNIAKFGREVFIESNSIRLVFVLFSYFSKNPKEYNSDRNLLHLQKHHSVSHVTLSPKSIRIACN
jgi:hypothetical protein